MLTEVKKQLNQNLRGLHLPTIRQCYGCFRCLLLVMCTHPFAKGALTLHLARGEGHKRYFDCNLMHREVLASSHQHLMAEAPSPFDLDDTIVPARLEDLAVETRWPEEATDDLLVEFESIRDDQGKTLEIHPPRKVAKQSVSVPVASPSRVCHRAEHRRHGRERADLPRRADAGVRATAGWH